MSDLSYLQDAAWLAEREKKWIDYSKRWLFEAPVEEVRLMKAYFFDGNVKHLLTDSYNITLSDVISIAPINDAWLVINNISEYWFWVLESPDSRDYYQSISDVDQRFIYHFNSVFSRKGDYLQSDVCISLFFWLYGKTYQGNRAVSLSHDGREVSIPVDIDVNKLSYDLLNGIIKYIWRQGEGQNICIFKAFIPYFLSIYPKMSPICFDTKLPELDEFEGDDGKRYFEKYWIWNRWLLTALNGFVSEYEEDEGIEELVCNDGEAFVQLNEGLNALQMPEEFFRLKEFVLKHKGESLYASE